MIRAKILQGGKQIIAPLLTKILYTRLSTIKLSMVVCHIKLYLVTKNQFI